MTAAIAPQRTFAADAANRSSELKVRDAAPWIFCKYGAGSMRNWAAFGF